MNWRNPNTLFKLKSIPHENDTLTFNQLIVNDHVLYEILQNMCHR